MKTLFIKFDFPSTFLAGDFSVSTTLYPVVPRDTDMPDLGYHYYALDYQGDSLTVEPGVTLALTNGALMGVNGNHVTVNGTLVADQTLTGAEVQEAQASPLGLYLGGNEAAAYTDADGDGLPDWWEQLYYGNLNQTATNLDTDGNPLLADYQSSTVPANLIQFTVEVANNYVSTTNATVQANITAGVAGGYAVVVDDTNYVADASWQTYTGTNLTVHLGTNEGWHDIWIGLRGPVSGATQTWEWKRLKLDQTPPWLTVTNPTVGTNCVPLIQLQGYSPEELDSISYDITNALGLVTNQDAGITDQIYDTNTWDFTTNYFECVDVPLTNGVNKITLHATDLAGNVMTTNFNFTVDYTTATNPVVRLTWPTNGMEICQSNITLRGWVDDPTASVSAQIVSTNGATNLLTGEIERTGVLWVENLPLNSDTNFITLWVTNAAGLPSSTNCYVIKNDMTLTLTNIDGDLWQPTVNVSGLISASNYCVWVNGVRGTNYGNGTWSATNVPVSAGGVASFDMSAVNGGDPCASQDTNKPVRLYVKQNIIGMGYFEQEDGASDDSSSSWQNLTFESYNHVWTDGMGGDGSVHFQNSGHISPDAYGWPYLDKADASFSWPSSLWPHLVDGTYTLTGTNWDAWEMFDGSTGSGVWYKLGDEHADDFLAEWEEHCGINLTWDWKIQGDGVVENFHNNYHRTADTTWHLQTGGKALPHRQSLWRLSSSAAAISGMAVQKYPWIQPPSDVMSLAGYLLPYDYATSTPIPSQNITIDSKPVGSDGNQWRTYADNDDRDVTPIVKNKDFYTFNLAQQKYRLIIQANTHRIWPGHVSAYANFCVGQKITFTTVWSPSTPPFDYRSLIWNYSADYVNNHWTDANGCEEYNISPSIAQSDPTTAWFYNKQTQDATATIGQYCHFSNGQSAYLIAQGKFDVYRPSLTWLKMFGSPYISIYDGSTLSVGTNTGVGNMCYNIYVNTKYPGMGGITQLIKGKYYGYSGVFIWSDTGGSNDLDNVVMEPLLNVILTV